MIQINGLRLQKHLTVFGVMGSGIGGRKEPVFAGVGAILGFFCRHHECTHKADVSQRRDSRFVDFLRRLQIDSQRSAAGGGRVMGPASA